LADFHLDWSDDDSALSVWDSRPSPIFGTARGPVLHLYRSRPTSGKETQCFEGFFNPERTLLSSSEALVSVHPLALCPDPVAAGDATAFRLDVRMRSGDLKHLVFSVKGFATGDADVTTNGREPHGHVRLPTDSRPFR